MPSGEKLAYHGHFARAAAVQPRGKSCCWLLCFRKLEGKVVEISRLQQVFTEKVLEQEGDIYRINEVAIHTTENIKSGNEQIREVSWSNLHT